MRMMLIAGHGAGDPGAIGEYGGVTYREADEARNMVSLIAAELKKQGVDVQVRDITRNANEDWKAGKLAFPSNLNYVLEIHFNALLAGADGKTKGVECYVTTGEKGVSVEQGICAAVASFGLTNRGVKRKNFNVIYAAKKAGISAALLEVCFIDDKDDMSIYVRNHEAIAKRVAQAVCEGFGIENAPKSSRQVVQEAAKLKDSTMDYLAAYRWGSDLLDKLAAAIINGPRYL